MLYREFASQEEIDQQYNPSLSLPGAHRWLQYYADESARCRADLECLEDLRFGPTRDETLDLFPAGPQAPLLMFVHGGYWRWGSSKDFSLVARGLVARGVSVAVSNYSLCPKVSLAEITRQSRAALSWLHAHGADYGADTQRLFVAGHSAGGQQAAMLALTDWAGDYGLPGDLLKGALPVSGVFDLRPLRYSWLQPKLLLSHELLREQSPALLTAATGAPLLLSLGGEESDEFHRQSQLMAQVWREQGFAAELLVQAGRHHFDAIDGYTDPHSELCDATLAFMQQCLAGAA